MIIDPAAPLLTTPFPGFRPFERHEAAIFFGRYDQVNYMLRRLETHPFLVVVGASGSGKSSLVRAGLLPALDEGLLFDAGSQWHVAILRPGEDPFRALATALSVALAECIGHNDDDRRSLIQAALLSGSHGLSQVVNDAQMAPGENVLLFVDQFEELFSFHSTSAWAGQDTADVLRSKYEKRNSAHAFVNLLLETVRQQSGQRTSELAASAGGDGSTMKPKCPIFIVLTMRSEYIGYCDAFLGLPEAISERLFLTPRMNRDQLKDAIVRPLYHFKATADSGLVNRIMNDADSDQDSLPLMEHALLRTWQKANERCESELRKEAAGRIKDQMDLQLLKSFQEIELTIEDYENAGGFKDALSLHADEAYKEIGRDPQRGEHYQRISQLLFRSLTRQTDEGMWVRNPIKVTEAALIAGASVEEVLHVVEAFRREGRNFITSSPRDQPLGRDSTLDISHESLIRRWRILRDWISAEQKDAEIYKQISYHARRWEENNKKRWMLLRPLLLADNIAWRENLKPTEAWPRRYNNDFSLCMEYLHACVLLRAAFIIFAVLTLIASLGGQSSP